MAILSIDKFNQSTAQSDSSVSRWLRRLIVVSWVGWAASLLSLWVQYQIGIYDTVGWLWVPFAAAGAMAGIAASFVGVVEGLLGPRRSTMFGRAVLGILPLVLSAAVAGYIFFEQGQKNLPNTHVHKIGRMAAVTLLKGHAQLRYPHRLETSRLVMYYDDRVTDPAGDAALMDAHLSQLETVLGRQQHSKIHWVRGNSLGMHAMSIHSVALASDASPASWFDRHELAHSFLYQFSDRGSEPPMLLLEGWAMAVDGHPEPLAMTALAVRKNLQSRPGMNDCLRTILSPDSYHIGSGPAYNIGGAFVDFLLNRYGADKFVSFYNSIHPESFDADCERIFGCDLDALERAFWEELESRSGRGQ